MIGVHLIDTVTAPNDPYVVSGYVADLSATRPAGWTPRVCKFCYWKVVLYEKANPKPYEGRAKGRSLTLRIKGEKDLTTVKNAELRYADGTTSLPGDPPFEVHAAERCGSG
jgi:hypothetical protein